MCPPAATPYVARQLVQPHAYVGRDTRIAVQSAVVVNLVGGQADVVPTEHLAGGLVASDCGICVAVCLSSRIVEEAKVHWGHQAVNQPSELWHRLPHHDQTRGIPAVVDVGDEIAVVAVSYTHLRAHETRHDLVCRLL